MKKKRRRVVLIVGLLLFFAPVIMVPFIVSVAQTAIEESPVLIADWIKSSISSWLDSLFDNTDKKIAEWSETIYPKFSKYSTSDYPQFYLAEGISLYQYLQTGEDISDRLLSMDEYMNFFKNSEQRVVFSNLSTTINWNIAEEDSEAVYSIASSMKEFGTMFPNANPGVSDIDYKSDGTVTGDAIAWAIAIAENDSYGYSQINRYGNPDYDCSSFVTAAYIAAGVGLRPTDFTGTMISDFTQHGFVQMTFTGEGMLQAGDVLWNIGHTEMYIGNGYQVGAHSNVSPAGFVFSQGGDQFDSHDWNSYSGEISITPYYNSGWTVVLRYVGN